MLIMERASHCQGESKRVSEAGGLRAGNASEAAARGGAAGCAFSDARDAIDGQKGLNVESSPHSTAPSRDAWMPYGKGMCAKMMINELNV